MDISTYMEKFKARLKKDSDVFMRELREKIEEKVEISVCVNSVTEGWKCYLKGEKIEETTFVWSEKSISDDIIENLQCENFCSLTLKKFSSTKVIDAKSCIVPEKFVLEHGRLFCKGNVIPMLDMVQNPDMLSDFANLCPGAFGDASEFVTVDQNQISSDEVKKFHVYSSSADILPTHSYYHLQEATAEEENEYTFDGEFGQN
jgi:hypothetical protein